MIKLHRLILITTICFLALFIFTSQVHALFDSNVDKAKEFMQAGMYPQAIALLEKEINDEPTNAEAHFQLGICYINQNNYGGADKRFASAVRLKPDYGYKIGKEYKKAAEHNLKKGRLSSVRTLYDKAIEYDPSLKKGIARELFEKGKQSGNDQFFSLAAFYDGALRDKIANYYYALSQESNGDSKISILKVANKYGNGRYRQEIGQALLIIVNNQKSEADRRKYIKDASKYVDKKAILESSVQFYTKLWGLPKKIVLDTEEWIEVAQIKYRDRIYYLSLLDFMKKGEGDASIYEAYISKLGKHSYSGIISSSGSFPLKFKRYGENTIVYVWIERKDSPFK